MKGTWKTFINNFQLIEIQVFFSSVSSLWIKNINESTFTKSKQIFHSLAAVSHPDQPNLTYFMNHN